MPVSCEVFLSAYVVAEYVMSAFELNRGDFAEMYPKRNVRLDI